jgi:hypothetical protein
LRMWHVQPDATWESCNLRTPFHFLQQVLFGQNTPFGTACCNLSCTWPHVWTYYITVSQSK